MPLFSTCVLRKSPFLFPIHAVNRTKISLALTLTLLSFTLITYQTVSEISPFELPVVSMSYELTPKSASFELLSSSVSPNVKKYSVLNAEGSPVSFSEAIHGLKTNDDFLSVFLHSLHFCEHTAFFFEARPVNAVTATSTPFEFVLVKATALESIHPEPDTFSDYYKPGCGVAVFQNLGGDATLVAPCPSSQANDFGDIARFMRNAPPEQVRDFWRRVGGSFDKILTSQTARNDVTPVWLSTSGLGVYWLHVRLDRRPKYYTYAPYKQWASS